MMTDALPATDLDAALRLAAASPEDVRARLGLHAELSRAEVFVLLEREVSGGRLEPRVFDLSDGRAVLAFDSEMRLAGFAGQAAPYAALPGRVLVAMLAAAPEPLALALNPDVGHAALLPSEALSWLAATLEAPAPAEDRAVPEGFAAPALTDAVLALLVPALERRLSGLPGLTGAVLAGVRWQGGGRGHVLALQGLPEIAQPPVARAVAEALALSGLEGGSLDVVFPGEAAMAAIAACGLALSPDPAVAPDDQIVTPDASGSAGPGLDPTRPPRLK